MGRQAVQTFAARPFKDALIQSLRHMATHPAGPHKGKINVDCLRPGHEPCNFTFGLDHNRFKPRQPVGVWRSDMALGL